MGSVRGEDNLALQTCNKFAEIAATVIVGAWCVCQIPHLHTC